MQPDQNNFEFDEPRLKEALKRVYPPEVAPPALRAGIQVMLTRAAASGVSDQPIPLTRSTDRPHHWWQSRRVTAAAAIVGLGLGVGLFVLTERDRMPSGNAVAMNESPVIVQNALVSHDQIFNSMASGGDNWRRSLAPVPQVREELRSHAPMSIPTVDLSSRGWQLAGAKACEVGSACAAQMFYTRGDQTLSVFVLPPGQSAVEIQRSCGQSKTHITAARNASGATFLLVGRCTDGSLTNQEIEELAATIAAQ